MRNPYSIALLLLLAGISTLISCQNKNQTTSLTPELVSSTEKLFDLTMDPSERDSMITALESQLSDYKIIHSQSIDNSVPPAIWFNPVPAGVV